MPSVPFFKETLRAGFLLILKKQKAQISRLYILGLGKALPLGPASLSGLQGETQEYPGNLVQRQMLKAGPRP